MVTPVVLSSVGTAPKTEAWGASGSPCVVPKGAAQMWELVWGMFRKDLRKEEEPSKHSRGVRMS